jgi:hypothetical protein
MALGEQEKERLAHELEALKQQQDVESDRARAKLKEMDDAVRTAGDKAQEAAEEKAELDKPR